MSQLEDFTTSSDSQKAIFLQRVGFTPAGSGNGPIGESEWWVPFGFGDEMVCLFARAVELVQNRMKYATHAD